MALQKQPVTINFAEGLDTKTDDKQVGIGKFLSLQNSVFTKAGLLQKRNGFQKLGVLASPSSYLTTFNNNLTAIGQAIQAYSSNTETFVTKGNIAPLSLNTLSLIRNNINQTQVDATISNNTVCTVYTETNGSAVDYKYAIADATTGQNIVSPTLIPTTSGSINNAPRVFVLSDFFIIAYETSGNALQYISIPVANPSIPNAPKNLATSITSSSRINWDGVVVGQQLFFAYNTVSGGQSVKVSYLSSTLANPPLPYTFAGAIATNMSISGDTTGSSPIIYISYYDSASSTGDVAAVSSSLNEVLAPTQIITAELVLNITCVAQNGSCTSYYEIAHNYSYDSAIPTHYVNSVSCSQTGTVSAETTIARSIGLASKAFLVDGIAYFYAAYQSPYQPSYFLINASLSLASAPVVVAEFAYSNGGGYVTSALPSVVVDGTSSSVAYLYKDLIAAVNKGTALAAGTQTAGIYSQTGCNLITIDLETASLDNTEIGSNLNISGGFLWGYDGYLPVENNFFVWPDSIEASWSTTGGSVAAQPDGSTNTNAYYYQATYEWTDNQGNAQRSAPSIPVAVTTTGSGTTGSITINVPYLRLTYKIANPVKIVLYRWSVAQQVYYQVTSIQQPILNSTTADSVAYVDTLPDATILGNNIIYTTGGVVEDLHAPATNLMTLFDTRLWLVDAEDKNLLWFSKQVIEATPVEMSDLFTFYIAPTTAAQGSTGVITALSVMDDKLIIFKRNALLYINGTGPDNTGANNNYSAPTFVTSTVGCANQQSIVFSPNGLMFQSDKGIWLLGRDLSTNYIGAPVEKYTQSATVLSAVNVPGTNQVRFTLDSGITLMYDYYYGQWGTFVGIPGISSTIYNNAHTFVDSYGQVFQEEEGTYLDGSSPVLLSFTTSWIHLAGLEGYERAYYAYLLGTYLSPHKLAVQIAYDYNSYPSQQSLISPNNYTAPWGGDPTWGASTPWGGIPSLENWKVHLQRQTCTAFSVTINEIFDPAYGTVAGAGLTLSGLNLIVGIKKGRNNIRSNSVG